MQHFSSIPWQALLILTRFNGLPSPKRVKYEQVKQSRGWTVILQADIADTNVRIIVLLSIFAFLRIKDLFFYKTAEKVLSPSQFSEKLSFKKNTSIKMLYKDSSPSAANDNLLSNGHFCHQMNMLFWDCHELHTSASITWLHCDPMWLSNFEVQRYVG